MSAVRTNRRELLQRGAFWTAGGLVAGSLASRLPAPLAAEASTRSGASRLKITAVKTFLLRHKLKRPFGVSVSVPLDPMREALLVKIETDAGITGWGETSPIGGARGTIDDHLGPQLIGQNPLETRRLWNVLWGANFGNALATAALDMALLDVRGRALGLPVAELFGGRLRDRVPAYASGMNYVEGMNPADQFPAEARALKQQGYKMLKMRIGRYSVSREAAIAKAVRDAVGPDIKLMADGNGAYTLASAIQMGRALDRLGFEAFEEPLPQSPAYAGYDVLRQKLPLSLAAGEAVDSRGAAKALIDRRAMDIIQPDVSLCGGIGEALFIAELAALSGMRCLPHCWGGAIVIAATTHLMALLPEPHAGLTTDTPMLELDQSENPWRTEIVEAPVAFHDGFVSVPTAPGLGIAVKEAAVMRYAV